MANIRATLLRQVKVNQVYTSEYRAAFRKMCTDSEWEAFQKSLDRAPWRFCRFVMKGGKYALRVSVLPTPDVESRARISKGPTVSPAKEFAGSYNLIYRENGARCRPTVVKVLNDPGIAAEIFHYQDIVRAIEIVENRLMAAKLRGEKTIPDNSREPAPCFESLHLEG
jgi:hypothetical protein